MMWPFRTRRVSSPRPLRRSVPTLELLERRELLAAGAFLQGTVFLDSNASNQLTAADSRVSGATVQLFQGSSATPLQTTTTDASGNYLFSGLAPGNYRIVETPVAGYANSGTQILSQLNPASPGLTPNTILATVVDPTQVYVNFNGTGPNFEVVNDVVNGVPTADGNAVGQLQASLGTTAGAADLNAGYVTFCADDLHSLSSFSGGDEFQVLPSPTTSITNGSTTISPANAGEIAYLYNHYGNAPLTSIQAGALQLALWELVYDTGSTPDFTSGNFQASFAPAFSSDTSSTDFANVVNQATAYFNEAKASAPETAIFLDNTLGGPSAPAIGDQGLLATESLNFANVAKANPSIATSASATHDGVVGSALLSDAATIAGGNNPTGTIIFTLYAASDASYSHPLDTEAATVSGNGEYSTPHGYLPTAPGTYQWLANYGGDDNNNSVGSHKGDEPVTVSAASPTLVTTASFSAGNVVGGAIPQDSAVLSGGYHESGTITFTLTAPNGTTVVDTETITPSGDGTYTTTNATVATQVGTYTWTVSYAGDGLNNSAHDQGGAAEQVTTVKASPSISTQASETAGGVVGSAVLSDAATLTGGYSITGGSITFKLKAPDGSTTTFGPVNVTAAGTYHSPAVTATEVGTYIWSASYSGDGLNNGVNDNGQNESELVTGATISGVKSNDTTGNGFSLDDTGLGGVTIKLYKDNGDGVLTSADAAVGTMTTAANGAFSFTGLGLGTYFVQESVPTGYVQTAGGPLGSVGKTYYAVKVTDSTTYSGNNFDDIEKCDDLQPGNTDVTNIKYVVSGSYGTSTVTDLRGHTHQGDTVTVTFTVAANDTEQLSLVSYVAPGASFDANTASQQKLFQVATGTFTGGTHSLTVTIPNCYYQIDFVCGAAIDHLGPAGSNIFYSAQGRLFSADNGGTCPAPAVSRGDFATIGFWHNRNGQALIDSLNGGSSSTALSQWLATSFPKLYGPSAGPTSLAGKTNAQVAAAFLSSAFFGASGQKTNAQVLAAALAAYATNTNLAGGNYAAAYGFNTSTVGTGIDVYNVGSNGSALGLTDNSSYTVMQLLQAVNAKAGANGSLSSAVANAANTVFSGVNQVGDLTLLASGSDVAVGATHLVISPAVLATGQVWVSVDSLDPVVGVEQQASIDAAIASLNSQLGRFGLDMIDVTGDAAESAVADVTITMGDTTTIGGVPEGVLGVTLFGGSITLVSGWDWYYGADATQIGAGQYDFQTVVTHELGHALDLGHSADGASVMYPYLGEGEARRTLTAGDLSEIDAGQNGSAEPLMAAPQAAHAAAAPSAGLADLSGGGASAATPAGPQNVNPTAELANALSPSGGAWTIAPSSARSGAGAFWEGAPTPGHALVATAETSPAMNAGGAANAFVPAGEAPIPVAPNSVPPAAAAVDAHAPSPAASVGQVPAQTGNSSGFSLPCDAFFAAGEELSIVEAQAMSLLDRADTVGGLALSAAALVVLLQAPRDEAARQDMKRRPRFAFQA